MLLAVDVGNTQTVLGLYPDGQLTDHWRLATERSSTADELGVLLGGLLDLDSVDGICVASTVPVLVREWELLAPVDRGTATRRRARREDRDPDPVRRPAGGRSDRIVNSVAAKERVRGAGDRRRLRHLDQLRRRLARGRVRRRRDRPRDRDLDGRALRPRGAPRQGRLLAASGGDREDDRGRLQSGLVYGFAGQVDGIVGRVREELGADAPAVATGGLADLVAPHSRTIERVDPFLDARRSHGMGAEPVIPESHSLALFVVAALALLVVPGPAVLYVVARSIHEGRRAGIASVVGIHVGTLVHIAAATVGLSALVVSSTVAFTAVKLAGAAYLVGLELWTLSRHAEPDVALGGERNLRRAFAQGVVVNVLNPKTALFFLAFLPQFVDADATHPGLQIAFLGLLFATLGLVTDSLWALAAGTAGRDPPGLGAVRTRPALRDRHRVRRPRSRDRARRLGGRVTVCATPAS